MRYNIMKQGLALLILGVAVTGAVFAQEGNERLITPPAPSLASAPAAVAAVPESYYAADAAAIDSRFSELESQLKKKQDKPDPKKGFTRVIDGRVYFDTYHLSGDGNQPTYGRFGQNQNSNGIRDLRIGVKGEGFDILDYKVDIHLADAIGTAVGTPITGTGNNNVGVRDVWLGIKNVPLLEYFKIGHYRVEDGVSNLTGGTNTTFFEFEGRDFATGRRFGVSTQHLWAGERIRFFAGIFEARNFVQRGNRFDTTRDDHGSITNLRLTYLPYISKGKDGKANGKKFLLLGGNFSYFDVQRSNNRGTHDASNFTERFSTLEFANSIGLPGIFTNSYQKYGLEFAWQNGPLTVQSETYANVYNNVASAGFDRTVWGTYAEVRYFLTGDYRKFSTSTAAWGAVDLRHNLELKKVNDWNFAKWIGGWEAAAKWAYTDTSALSKFAYDSSSVFAGEVNDLTLGLNWYWSPQARVMFDYIHVMPSQIRPGQSRDHSDIDIFATSFRYHF